MHPFKNISMQVVASHFILVILTCATLDHTRLCVRPFVVTLSMFVVAHNSQFAINSINTDLKV